MPTRRFLVTLLLASFGLISACGAGLHQFVDGSPPRLESGAQSGASDPDAPAWTAGHADCSVCHALGQSLLATAATPAVALDGLRGGAPLPDWSPERTAARRSIAPRAPPIARV